VTNTEPTDPEVRDLDDARRWIAILHRRSVTDADEIGYLLAMVGAMSAPWWRRRRAVAAVVRWRTNTTAAERGGLR
jgi:hypothetical protein